MQTITNTFKIIIIAITILAFAGCDIIEENNYLKKTSNNDTTTFVKKILLEEFTGFRCGNCPEAHEIAHFLKTQYPNTIVLCAIHAGYFARPTTEHPYDFRTAEGTELDQFFNCSSAGLPNGMINRKLFNNQRVVTPSNWEQYINQIINEKPTISLELNNSFSPTTNEISLEVKINYIDAGTPNHHLCIYLVEDSIVNYQTDYRQQNPNIENYVHKNVLRATITGTWGEQISEAAIPKGAKFVKNYTYKIPDGKDWKPSKMRIIAFIHDHNNTQEVLQTEEVSVIK